VTVASALGRLTDDQRAIRDAVRTLARERVAPRAAEIDRSAEFPEDLRVLLAEQGILGLPFPERHGGLGADLLTVCLSIEALSAACATTGLILAVQELGALPTPEPLAAPGSVEERTLGEVGDLPPVRVVERIVTESSGPSIEEARVIVAGGRGVGGPDGFAGLRELAGLLGGAVGATRAAVDAGWIAYATQIGQTGKIVKPTVYLAFGVSGAIQHKVGMQTSETIIAVNRDPDAPIGEFADLFVVADLAAVVPALSAALRARAG